MERGFVQIPGGPSSSQQRHTDVHRGPIQVFHIRENDFAEAIERLRRVRRCRVQSGSVRRRHVQRSVQSSRRVQDYDSEKRLDDIVYVRTFFAIKRYNFRIVIQNHSRQNAVTRRG